MMMYEYHTEKIISNIMKVHSVSFFIVRAAWFILLLQSGVHSVVITELKVPPFVKNGTNAAVTLDCQYTLSPEEQGNASGLVVKWFFDKGQKPVYQWIHNQKPQALGAFRDHVWLDYRASNDNTTAYRALHILNPTVELSGQYKCVVSTNSDEDFSMKKMIVFAPEKQLDIFHTRYDVETINITCRAVGVYPQPEITLFNESTKLEDIILISTKRTDSYDVTAYVLIPDTELPTPTAIVCQLSIPETPYKRLKTLQYNPGSTESLSSVSGCAVFKRRSTSTDTVISLLLALLVFTKLNAV